MCYRVIIYDSRESKIIVTQNIQTFYTRSI